MSEPKTGNFDAYVKRFLEEIKFFCPSEKIAIEAAKFVDACREKTGSVQKCDPKLMQEMITLAFFSELEMSEIPSEIKQFVKRSLFQVGDLDFPEQIMNETADEFIAWIQAQEQTEAGGYVCEDKILQYAGDGNFIVVPI